MWGSWTTGAWVCPPGGALTVATRFDMQLSVEAHRNSSRIVYDMKIRRPEEKMDVWWGIKQEWGLFYRDEHAGLTSGGDEQRLWWEESLRYCDRNKRGCVYLMPEKSDRKTVLYFSRDGWKQRPMFFDDGSDDTSCERNAERLKSETEERRRRPKRRWWNEDGVGGRVGDDLSDEVKAGGSRPPVEWSSPGRRWAFFIFF